MFDPHNRFLNPALVGFRSVGGASVPLEWGKHGLFSKQLGLYLTVDDDHLRFIEPRTGKPLLTRRERVQRERIRADLEWERAELERTRADVASERAALASERAELQERRAVDFAAEVERLKARLAELEGR